MLYQESEVLKYLHLVHQHDRIQHETKEDSWVIQIGGIVPFLLTVSSVQLRHRVMSEQWDPRAAAVLSHSSTSVMQGQREDSFTLA